MEYERQRTYDILLGKEQGVTQKAEEDAIAFLKEGDSVRNLQIRVLKK